MDPIEVGWNGFTEAFDVPRQQSTQLADGSSPN